LIIAGWMVIVLHDVLLSEKVIHRPRRVSNPRANRADQYRLPRAPCVSPARKMKLTRPSVNCSQF
jgi:hypothetical protein